MPTLNQTRRTVKGDASSWPAWTDADRWELGPDPSEDWPPTSDERPYDPAPDFEPTPEDLADYAQWLDALPPEGGCSPTELSPSEVAMYAGTMSAFDYWRKHLDPAIDDPSEQLA